jgi:hypothetical protein
MPSIFLPCPQTCSSSTKNAASMPDFILAMEEAQKKANCAELPILDIELAMYTATSMLQTGDYKKESDKWEGRNAYK